MKSIIFFKNTTPELILAFLFSASIHNIIKILFLQKYDVSFAFVHLFVIYKHGSV